MRPLGDLVILAVQAMEVAADRSNRQAARPGMEMIERFLLDRIDIFRDRLTVDQAVKVSAAVFTDPAAAPSPIGYDTVEAAELATNPGVAGGFPEFSLVEFHSRKYNRKAEAGGWGLETKALNQNL